MKKKHVKCVLETQYIYYGIEKLHAEKNASRQEMLQREAQQQAIEVIYSILFSESIGAVL